MISSRESILDFNSSLPEGNDSVEALIERIKHHDMAALSDLYDLYSAKVYSVAYYVTHDDTLAAEATQDAFMKVWHHADQYQNMHGRFLSWLLVVTRRCGLDLMRAEYRKSGRLLAFDVEEFNFEQLIDTDAQDEARWQDLKTVLTHLPSEQRDVIELSFYQGLSQNDIAAHLNLPLGTVKTRAMLAMRKLREAFFRG